MTFADFWIQDQEFRDPDTGESFDRDSLNNELEKIEKPAGISQSEGFPQRDRQLRVCVRGRTNGGKNPAWTSYEKFRTVIEKKMFSNTEELLPVISFNAKASAEDANKHADFVARMVEKGYTRQAGAAAVRMVSAGEEVVVDGTPALAVLHYWPCSAVRGWGQQEFRRARRVHGPASRDQYRHTGGDGPRYPVVRAGGMF